MEILAKAFVVLVAIEHLYILVLEMFLWTKPRTRKVFGVSAELAEQTKAMAANQGLYNGFLAAGLLWGLLHSNLALGFQFSKYASYSGSSSMPSGSKLEKLLSSHM